MINGAWFEISNLQIIDLSESNRPNYDIDLKAKLVARNAPFLSACNQSDIMISPTEFQRSTAPVEYQEKIKVNK